MLGVAANVRDIYLEGCAPFQDDYIHVWAFVYDFLTGYFALLRDWAKRARAAVERWQDLEPEGKRDEALDLFERKRPQAVGGTSKVPAKPGEWHHHAARRLREHPHADPLQSRR
jgi:hypothetical protein